MQKMSFTGRVQLAFERWKWYAGAVQFLMVVWLWFRDTGLPIWLLLPAFILSIVYIWFIDLPRFDSQLRDSILKNNPLMMKLIDTVNRIDGKLK